MAISLSSLSTTKSDRPPVCIFYGADGIGKTSLASEFPDPIYLHTSGEEAPDDADMGDAGALITSLPDLWSIIGQLLTEEHGFKTVIIDSLDGLEPLIWAETCARIGATSIDDNSQGSPAGFGRGFREADVEWNQYLDALNDLTQAGMAVVQLAHPGIVNFKSPITDPYDRYDIKINKRAAALVREKAKLVAFMNRRVSLKSVEVARNKSVSHAEGGKDIQIHTEESAGFNAKNRCKGMPAVIPFKRGQGYAELSKYLAAPTGVLQASNDNQPARKAA